MVPQKLNSYNVNVSLHLLFLALHFTSLIYKMVDNCVDTIAIKTYNYSLKKHKKSKIHLPRTINHQYQETKHQELFYIIHLQLFTF